MYNILSQTSWVVSPQQLNQTFNKIESDDSNTLHHRYQLILMEHSYPDTYWTVISQGCVTDYRSLALEAWIRRMAGVDATQRPQISEVLAELTDAEFNSVSPPISRRRFIVSPDPLTGPRFSARAFNPNEYHEYCRIGDVRNTTSSMLKALEQMEMSKNGKDSCVFPEEMLIIMIFWAIWFTFEWDDERFHWNDNVSLQHPLGLPQLDSLETIYLIKTRPHTYLWNKRTLRYLTGHKHYRIRIIHINHSLILLGRMDLSGWWSQTHIYSLYEFRTWRNKDTVSTNAKFCYTMIWERLACLFSLFFLMLKICPWTLFGTNGVNDIIASTVAMH